MSANHDDSVSVRILFDKEKNQVICAEAGSDFIDILFGFLTLPMGTIIRLIQKQKPSDCAQIGCISNLYQSVKDLSLDSFCTDPCKDMLMYPKSPLEITCKDLKVNVDDTPIRYFVCADEACSNTLSYYKNAKCFRGNLFNIDSVESSGERCVAEGLGPKKDIVEVFVKKSTTYVVTDDMKVKRGTPCTLLEVLHERGIDSVNLVEEKVIKVGPKEILNLLECILVSKTPLTDSFLRILPNKKLNSKNISGEEVHHHFTSSGTSVEASDKSVEIKILVRKSNKKPLYAEVMEDFVELLLSFLTFPLSNVVSLLSCDSSLGCVDNLYKSVQGLDDKWWVEKNRPEAYGSLFTKSILLNPGIAPNFSCSTGKSIICEVKERKIRGLSINEMGEIHEFPLYQRDPTILVADPKSLIWGSSVSNFLKGPAMFLVSDSLVIKSCDNTTINISFLKDLGVPIDDIEEHTIKIAKQQVLSILKASLTTNSAFSPLMNPLSKKPKQERF